MSSHSGGGLRGDRRLRREFLPVLRGRGPLLARPRNRLCGKACATRPIPPSLQSRCQRGVAAGSSGQRPISGSPMGRRGARPSARARNGRSRLGAASLSGTHAVAARLVGSRFPSRPQFRSLALVLSWSDPCPHGFPARRSRQYRRRYRAVSRSSPDLAAVSMSLFVVRTTASTNSGFVDAAGPR